MSSDGPDRAKTTKTLLDTTDEVTRQLFQSGDISCEFEFARVCGCGWLLSARLPLALRPCAFSALRAVSRPWPPGVGTFPEKSVPRGGMPAMGFCCWGCFVSAVLQCCCSGPLATSLGALTRFCMFPCRAWEGVCAGSTASFPQEMAGSFFAGLWPRDCQIPSGNGRV